MKILRILILTSLLLPSLAAFALPLPISNGVLTGPLNANGQPIANVRSMTFADGTSLSTAAGTGSTNGVTITNTPSTAIYLANGSLPGPVLRYDEPGTPDGVLLMVSLAGNGSAGSPLAAAFNTQGSALLYDEAGTQGGTLLFDP